MRRLVTFLTLLLLSVPVSGRPADGLTDFLDGLEHLEGGRWKEAEAAFAEAIEQDEENPRHHLARGVARALSENLPGALADFDRALRLAPDDRHARLWKSAVTNMQGRFMEGAEIHPQATHDQYENQVQEMARLYGEFNFRKDRGESDPDWDRKWAADQDAARKSFAEIASLFTGRVKGTSAELGPLMIERAEKKMAARDFAGALADLHRAAEAAPNDLRITLARATCDLNLGASAAARAHFVRVLTAQPNNADAWFGHALACATLGDAARAAAGLENAIALNPSNAKAYRDALAAASAASTAAPSQSPVDLVAELRRKAGDGAPSDDLLKHASSIILKTNASRLRADETHLDRRLRLEAVVHANPGSAVPLADLGEFLYAQAVSIRGEAVEPRADFATYRPQTEQTQMQEISSAEQILAEALKLDPRNVKALTYKAACAMFRLQWAEAEALLRTALSMDAGYGPLLQTFAKVMDHAAAMKAMAATDLRSVKSWEDANYYYYRRPTQAELQQADEYDRQARALWAIAERHLEAAAASHAGKPEGFYYAGVLAERRGQAGAARTAFEQCVAMAPDHAAAWDELTKHHHRAGNLAEAAAARSAAANLQHTTAGHHLRLAWSQIVRTTYKSAAQTLQTALVTDPADARVHAYLAVIAQSKGDAAAALAWWKCAAAMEEAHARLNGVDFRSPSIERLAPELLGRAMAINLRLGRLALELDQPELAAASFSANLNLAQCVGKMDRFILLPSSQLPDQQTDQAVIPESESALSLAAWSMLGLGQALAKQQREAEAMQQFEAVRQLPSQVPPTIDHRGRLGDPCVLATIAMLKPLIERKEFQAAQDLLRSGGCEGGASKGNVDELRRMGGLIESRLADQRMEDADREMEDARRRLLEERERQQKEREERDQRRRRDPRGSPR